MICKMRREFHWYTFDKIFIISANHSSSLKSSGGEVACLGSFLYFLGIDVPDFPVLLERIIHTENIHSLDERKDTWYLNYPTLGFIYMQISKVMNEIWRQRVSDLSVSLFIFKVQFQFSL